jgi:hypothetical protein
LQIEVLAVSILFWTIIVLVLAWITKRMRDIEATLRNIKDREEKRDED